MNRQVLRFATVCSILAVVVSSPIFAQTAAKLDSAVLADTLALQRGSTRILVPYGKQGASTKEEDGPPSGPDVDISPTYLVDKFAGYSDSIDDDFDRYLPYSDELIRDHTSLNTFYFYPGGYLLRRDKQDGYDINFLHRTRDEESSSDLILLTFTLSPRHLDGALPLLEELADFAIEPLNNKPVDLNRLPISSVKVNLGGLTALIPEENVRVINSPRRVGDDIRVQASMTQSQKEDVVASIRSGGLSGDILFRTNNESFELVVPYYVSFTDYAGEWFSDVTELSTTDSFTNVSPFPLVLAGVAAYVKPSSSAQIRRYFVPLAQPTVLSPGAVASSDRGYDDLFRDYGEPVATWPVFERAECEECLDAIEREILVSPSMASRAELPIEVIPSVFEQFTLFKILVEIRSQYFSPSGDAVETRSFTLRGDETRTTAELYLDRENQDAETVFEYRIRPFHAEGLDTSFSDWQIDDGLMDITVHAGMIRPLVPSE